MSNCKIEAAIAALEQLNINELKQAIAHTLDSLEGSQVEQLSEFVSSLVGIDE